MMSSDFYLGLGIGITVMGLVVSTAWHMCDRAWINLVTRMIEDFHQYHEQYHEEYEDEDGRDQ